MSHSPAKSHYYPNENARYGRHGHENGGPHGVSHGGPHGASHGGPHGDNYHRETMPRGYPQNGEPIPRSTYADRTYSLPRTAVHQPKQAPHGGGYYTQDRRGRNGHQQHHHHHHPNNGYNGDRSGADTPDFYFMPSQRKYSGEVVRVYVDYNKEPKN